MRNHLARAAQAARKPAAAVAAAVALSAVWAAAWGVMALAVTYPFVALQAAYRLWSRLLGL